MTVTQKDADNVKFAWTDDTGIPGTWALVGTSVGRPSPVCMVWFRFNFMPKALEVVDSWVREDWRRRGIRTRANGFIFDNFSEETVERIVTQQGTDSGRPWMEAVGYKKTAVGYWSVTRKQFAKATK